MQGIVQVVKVTVLNDSQSEVSIEEQFKKMSVAEKGRRFLKHPSVKLYLDEDASFVLYFRKSFDHSYLHRINHEPSFTVPSQDSSNKAGQLHAATRSHSMKPNRAHAVNRDSDASTSDLDLTANRRSGSLERQDNSVSGFGTN